MAAEQAPPPAGRLGTVRVRTTAAAVAVVGVALLAGAFALVLLLRGSLTDQVRTSAELRAADVADVLESGTPPGDLSVNDDDDLAIQVLSANSQVLVSSGNVEGEAPLVDLQPGESVEMGDLPIGDDDDGFVVVAATASSTTGPLTVLVARSTESVGESAGVVVGVLAAGLPLLLLIVGSTTWFVVGRALAPVDAIRVEVDEISAAELHRRVPHPAGDDEIARLAFTMNRMLGRLERSQARQQRFISDASHELRSPVTTIRHHAEVAAAHPDQTTVIELAETVLVEDLRVQRLVEDLLLLARADENTLALRRLAVDLDDVVFAEAARLRDTTSKRIDTTGVSAGRVSGDPAHLRRLLGNLADNAARHAATRVTLALTTDADSIVLHVDDDGPGIPAVERERVFERFVRLDDARDRDAGGTGLGLAIVAEIARSHGGWATAGASPLGGARIELRLPALPGP